MILNHSINQPVLKLNFIFALGFASLVSLSIFYIFQLNAVTERMYLIENYDKKIENLSQENKLLEIKFSKANSLENIRSLVENLGLNPVGKTEYIEIPESTVVIKTR